MGRIVPVGSVQFTCCERGFTKNRPEDASLVGTLQHSRLICTVCIVVDSCDQATTTAWADLGGGRTDAVAEIQLHEKCLHVCTRISTDGLYVRVPPVDAEIQPGSNEQHRLF